MTEATIAPVRRSVHVRTTPEHAFRTYAERIADWWPVHTHSVGTGTGSTPVDVVFEGREGGRIYEVWGDGTRRDWGTVRVWDPPRRLVHSWTVNPANPETEIEVTFTPEGDGVRVELEHRGWERYGDRAEEVRGDYHTGWDLVLGAFVDHVRG
jgi:hypothetical protein